MHRVSLLEAGTNSIAWIKDFYNQAGVWWGPDPQPLGVHDARVRIVQRLCGAGPSRILDLGTGPGPTAAALADAGHHVVAIEFSPARAQYARELAAVPRRGSMAVLEADYYTVELEGRFDVVCCWEVFGLGSDADQRRLLRRIRRDWLAPGGCALVDVFNPAKPARLAGSERRLQPLAGVPGSVEMINRCHFDAVHCCWIDEWQPVAQPDMALAQAIRCYSPADLLLLLEDSGLAVKRIEVDGEALDLHAGSIATSGPLLDAWTYLVQLTPEP